MESSVLEVGVVIPTLGDRPHYLEQCLRSLKMNDSVFVAVVLPEKVRSSTLHLDPLVDLWIVDPGTGPSAAINLGISSLPDEIRFVGWIGDDDLMIEGALDRVSKLLDSQTDISAVYGMCQYIDAKGEILFTNRSGAWAKYLLRFGPNLLPQPGSLIRRTSWLKVGGLSDKLKWTFDLDLFIKLTKVGKVKYLNQTVAQFRWHVGSLTAGSRKGSVSEASSVRRHYLPRLIRPFSFLWEPFVSWCILKAGERISASQAIESIDG